jgi:hypothetical protein
MSKSSRPQFTAANSRRSLMQYLMLACLLVLGVLLSGCKGEQPKAEDQPVVSKPTVHRHTSPTETCFICDPSKRDSGRLWCKEHARYEDRCWECQPQLRDPKRPYCEEHGLYEDECFLCDSSRSREGTP